MKKIIYRSSKGFTLIELMIVVAIIAILAGVAIPSYIGYKYKVLQSEAYSNISAIYTLETAYSVEDETYLTSKWTPTNIPGTTPPTWPSNSNNFAILGFAPKGRFYYRYGIANSTTWVATPPSNNTVSLSPNIDIIIQAEGDIDGVGGTAQMYNTDEEKVIVKLTNDF